VEIRFSSRGLERTFNDATRMVRAYGKQMATVIQNRMAVLQNVVHLGKVPTEKPIRCHQLKQDRAGQFAVDLVQPYRLIFRPDHNPVPTLKDGGIDLTAVTAIEIIDVTDYH